MSFHDVQLPDDIEQGAKGGPRFKTTILGAMSGREQRNIEWTYPRHSWNIGYGIQDRDGYAAVVAFFYARQGRGYAFRFKDWTDYTSGSSESDVSGNRVLIGLGDGSTTQFQLIKYYTDSAATFSRKITRPVSGTTTIYLDGVQTTGFSVSTSGGIVTMNVAPSGGVNITSFFQFDVPVRFDSDQIQTDVTWYNAAAIPDINIVEVRE